MNIEMCTFYLKVDAGIATDATVTYRATNWPPSSTGLVASHKGAVESC